ncbi:DNA repair protein [Saccharata proteae CBS 121410]|uniref:DNA repair protein RAD14 n=1 Tax=Saccharata proteae CBS 121410 TaxID=1314787 RepID=A0A9P4HXT1_9PEZI|nr:DNA repair protein [Saccharata proteae CBS 121410]
MSERPSTPPPQTSHPGTIPKGPLTPEQVRKLEIARLKAKAQREQSDAAAVSARASNPPTTTTTQKRPHPTSMRNAATTSNTNSQNGSSRAPSMAPPAADDLIRPAKKFQSSAYIEYDFSKMTDTKGGFLSATDDPHNKALHAARQEDKPAHMTLAEWERHTLLQKLRAQKAGPFEPGINGLRLRDRDGKEAGKNCRECGSPEIDWQWDEILKLSVCNACKDAHPDKYSLLTKTEARSDYMLTEPELADPDLLPHLEKPNPHRSTYHNMQLFVRCQLEEYAFSAAKWGSAEAMDEAFEKREEERKIRKERKFKEKLVDLKKRTRVEAYRRQRGIGGAAGEEAKFGDKVSSRFGEKHEHEWGRGVEDQETGLVKKTCVECGMEVEELEF